MFPYYAISTSTTIKSNAPYTLLSTTSPYYVISTKISQEKDITETMLDCLVNGAPKALGHSHSKDNGLNLMMFYCDGNAIIKTPSNDEAFVSMTYIPIWAIPTETTASTTTATNTPEYVNGFSYGEILIAFFLLVLVTNQFFGGILNRLMGSKQKPTYKIRL